MSNLITEQVALYNDLCKLHETRFAEMSKELSGCTMSIYIDECFSSIALLAATVTNHLHQTQNLHLGALEKAFAIMYRNAIQRFSIKVTKH